MTTTDSLSFTLEAPARVPSGDPVPVVLRLRNVSAGRIEVHLQGREIVFDVVVRSVRGDTVWRRLAGRASLAILQLRPLAPGETIELREEWNQRDASGAVVPPGEYVLTAELPSDIPEPLRSSEARVQIAAR